MKLPITIEEYLSGCVVECELNAFLNCKEWGFLSVRVDAK